MNFIYFKSLSVDSFSAAFSDQSHTISAHYSLTKINLKLQITVWKSRNLGYLKCFEKFACLLLSDFSYESNLYEIIDFGGVDTRQLIALIHFATKIHDGEKRRGKTVYFAWQA